MNTNNTSALRKHVSPTTCPSRSATGTAPAREVVIVPTHTATLDELAFAIQMASEEQSIASRRRCALDELYINARKAGALGADRLSDIAWKE